MKIEVDTDEDKITIIFSDSAILEIKNFNQNEISIVSPYQGTKLIVERFTDTFITAKVKEEPTK